MTAQHETDNWRAFEAEMRVNFVRIAAITGFFAVHLLHYYSQSWGAVGTFLGFDAAPMPPGAHVAITVLCLGWLLEAFAVQFTLQQRFVPNGLAMAVTLGDLAWLTALLTLSTGPRSAMVAGYFLILIATGLRFDLRLVRWSTVAAIVAYLTLLGAAKWPSGLLKDVALESVPRHHQLMVLLALLFSGILIGQIVRHGYAIADDIAGRRGKDQG